MFTIGKECHIMIKGTIQQEYTTNINVYAPNIKASKYIKPILTHLLGKNINTIIIEGLNIPVSLMDRSSRQKAN